MNGFFHRRGTTLVLCFEQGKEAYDAQALAEKKSFVACHDGKEDIATFCSRSIEEYSPDRIYVEMNSAMPELKDCFPACMNVNCAVTWIAWDTLEQLFSDNVQQLSRMVTDSQQITFRGCPSKELLAPYSQAFRLMNQKASYLRQDPMGYHEKAFDLFLPFSLEAGEIEIPEEHYLPLWLDALDHPEHYEGKTLHFTSPLELRNDSGNAAWAAGRVVMTCCMADLQFMSFELESGADITEAGWAVFDASGVLSADAYGRRKLKLRPCSITRVPALKDPILKSNAPTSNKQNTAKLKKSILGNNKQPLSSRLLSKK